MADKRVLDYGDAGANDGEDRSRDLSSLCKGVGVVCSSALPGNREE